MKGWCNKKWETIDSPLGLFLECIFQVCIHRMSICKDDHDFEAKKFLQAKYAEFLGLPLEIEVHNPLTFAIAHRIHGRQMTTGWPRNPVSLRDRNDNFNNILIETRTSNFFKANFDEETYPQLKKLLLEVQLSPNIANKDLVLLPAKSKFDPVDDVIECTEDDDWGVDMEASEVDMGMGSEIEDIDE